MYQKSVDSFVSWLLFLAVNAAGIYLLVADDAFADIEHPVVVIVCYLGLYVNVAIGLFGYRIKEIGDSLKLFNLFGRDAELAVDEIDTLRSFMSYLYLLKSSKGNYLIWSTLTLAQRKQMNAVIATVRRRVNSKQKGA